MHIVSSSWSNLISTLLFHSVTYAHPVILMKLPMFYLLVLHLVTRLWFCLKPWSKRKSTIRVSYIVYSLVDCVPYWYTYLISLLASESDLFRKTSIATRLLSVFAKNYGGDYVRSVLHPVFQQLAEKPAEERTFELDPSKVGPGEDVTKNKQNVVNATEMFLNAICASANEAPR